MKPTVYKTVTTKAGVMLFVEESKTNWLQRHNEGDYVMTRDGDIKQIKKLTLTPDSEQCEQWTLVYTDETKGYESTVRKIIAQPLESNLSGIPYYELTPQEGPFELASVFDTLNCLKMTKYKCNKQLNTSKIVITNGVSCTAKKHNHVMQVTVANIRFTMMAQTFLRYFTKQSK